MEGTCRQVLLRARLAKDQGRFFDELLGRRPGFMQELQKELTEDIAGVCKKRRYGDRSPQVSPDDAGAQALDDVDQVLERLDRGSPLADMLVRRWRQELLLINELRRQLGMGVSRPVTVRLARRQILEKLLGYLNGVAGVEPPPTGDEGTRAALTYALEVGGRADTLPHMSMVAFVPGETLVMWRRLADGRTAMEHAIARVLKGRCWTLENATRVMDNVMLHGMREIQTLSRSRRMRREVVRNPPALALEGGVHLSTRKLCGRVYYQLSDRDDLWTHDAGGFGDLEGALLLSTHLPVAESPERFLLSIREGAEGDLEAAYACLDVKGSDAVFVPHGHFLSTPYDKTFTFPGVGAIAEAPLSSTEMCYLVAHRSVRVLMDGQVRTLSSRWRSDGQVFVCELDKATEVLVLPSFVAGTVFHGTLTPDKSDDKCCRLNIDKPYCMESLWPLVGTCRTIEALRQCPLDYATLVLSAALQKTFLKDFGSAGELLSGSWKGREGYAMTVQELNVALGMENRTVLAVLLEMMTARGDLTVDDQGRYTSTLSDDQVLQLPHTGRSVESLPKCSQAECGRHEDMMIYGLKDQSLVMSYEAVNLLCVRCGKCTSYGCCKCSSPSTRRVPCTPCSIKW